jgi:hypothetical protein
MSYAPCCFRLPFQLATGLRAFTLPPTFSTSSPPRPSQPPPPTSLFSAQLPPTPTFGSSGAPATRTPLPLLLISSPLISIDVSFLGTPMSTKDIGVSISPRTTWLSPGTPSSVSHSSPLLSPTHLLMTWTPSSRPVLRFNQSLHPTPLLLQVLQKLSPHHAWHRRPNPRHTQPRHLSLCHPRHQHHHSRLHPCHAQPRLHASPSHLAPTPEPSRVGSSVYHPVAMARDTHSTHTMVTCRAATVTKPVDRLQLFAAAAPPTLSLVLTSVCSALTDPHRCRAMVEYEALLSNSTWDLILDLLGPMSSMASGSSSTSSR